MKLQNHDLALRMAELARVIALRKVDDVLNDVTAAAKELIPGVDVAGVLLVGKANSFDTLAPTGELMFKLDELQMRFGEGPHAAAAILASREGEQLQSALSTRDRIGQAKGIIMERFKIDDVRAFAMLRQLSQDSNTKLIDVAQRVIDTRGE